MIDIKILINIKMTGFLSPISRASLGAASGHFAPYIYFPHQQSDPLIFLAANPTPSKHD